MKNKIEFESEDQAIETAMIMFACSDFRPWTKEKIIKRLKKAGMIKEQKKNNELSYNNKIIQDNRDLLLEQVIKYFYSHDKKLFETFEMYLNRIIGEK